MKKAAKWIMRLKACVFRAGRTSIFRLCKPRLLAGCVALLCGPLLAGLAQAVPIDIDGGDILVADGSANRLIRVDGETAVRSVISDFSNPAQGPGGFFQPPPARPIDARAYTIHTAAFSAMSVSLQLGRQPPSTRWQRQEARSGPLRYARFASRVLAHAAKRLVHSRPTEDNHEHELS